MKKENLIVNGLLIPTIIAFYIIFILCVIIDVITSVFWIPAKIYADLIIKNKYNNEVEIAPLTNFIMDKVWN